MTSNYYLFLVIVQTWLLPIISYLVLWCISFEVGRLLGMSKSQSKHLSTQNHRNSSVKDQTNWPNDGFKPQITMVHISIIDFMLSSRVINIYVFHLKRSFLTQFNIYINIKIKIDYDREMKSGFLCTYKNALIINNTVN